MFNVCEAWSDASNDKPARLAKRAKRLSRGRGAWYCMRGADN